MRARWTDRNRVVKDARQRTWRTQTNETTTLPMSGSTNRMTGRRRGFEPLSAPTESDPRASDIQLFAHATSPRATRSSPGTNPRKPRPPRLLSSGPSWPAKTSNNATTASGDRPADDQRPDQLDGRYREPSHANSRSECRYGYKAHIAIDPANGLVISATLTRGQRPPTGRRASSSYATRAARHGGWQATR